MIPLKLMLLDLYIVLFIRRMLMKFQPLAPWIRENKSITPINFYGNLKSSMEMGLLLVWMYVVIYI